MKILYLSDSYFPAKTANSVHIAKMCEALAACGHAVTLVGMKWRDKDDNALYDYYEVDNNFELSLNAIPQTKGALFIHAFLNVLKVWRLKPDMIISRSYVSTAILTLFTNSRNIVFETHSPYHALDSLRKWAFNRILKHTSFIIVISEALKKILVNEIKENNLPIIPVYVHHDGATEPKVKSFRRDNIVLSSTRLNAGYIGTVNRGRGIELIIELSKQMPEIEFHIIGGDINDLKKKLGVTPQQTNLICHGYVSPKETAYFKSNLDVLLAPYQEETIINSGVNTSGYMSPLKIFEYMSVGKPIIASDMPVIREILDDTNAVLVEPGDVLGWKQAINKLMDAKERNEIGAKALADFRAHFTWNTRCKKIVSQFLSLSNKTKEIEHV